MGSFERFPVARFEAAATLAGVHVVRTASSDLSLLLASYEDAGTEIGFSADLSTKLGIEPERDPRHNPATWISRARFGVASTGSVVVAERLARDRIAALLCNQHVLVLPSSAIVATQADAAPRVRACMALGLGYVTFITGPSRTSDIEKVLTLGAHGPAKVDVILVEAWDPGDD